LSVWLVGTSRGTISAVAGAIAFGNEDLAGIVLTSSVTSVKRTGAVPAQKLMEKEAVEIIADWIKNPKP
jgi:hypothetical protein